MTHKQRKKLHRIKVKVRNGRLNARLAMAQVQAMGLPASLIANTLVPMVYVYRCKPVWNDTRKESR